MLARYRNLAVPLAIVAAVVLFYMQNPWFFPASGTTERTVATVAFWILAIVVLVLMFEDRRSPDAQTVEVEGPAFARYLFSNTRAGLIWLPIRIFLGFQWLDAGWHKLTGEGWVDGGTALLGYWERAVAIPEEGRPAISFEWYRTFLQFLIDNGAHAWFAWLITVGEIAVGIGLLVGALVGVAAFFGALMNMSFLLAGSASSNPVLFTFAIGLMLAWKVAGYYGVDRWLLPRIGVPWHSKVTTVGGSPGPANPSTT
jgi:thiosulfate dehydrogenase [quinone] large subunit